MNYLDSIPLEILDVIYDKKHKLEMNDICNDINKVAIYTESKWDYCCIHMNFVKNVGYKHIYPYMTVQYLKTLHKENSLKMYSKKIKGELMSDLLELSCESDYDRYEN